MTIITKSFSTRWSIYTRVTKRNHKRIAVSLGLLVGGVILSFLLPHPFSIIGSTILGLGAFACGTGVIKFETSDPKFDEHTKF